jgi:hypothetical protein
MAIEMAVTQKLHRKRGKRNRNAFLFFLGLVYLAVTTTLWRKSMDWMPQEHDDIPIQGLPPLTTREYLIPDTPDPLPLSKIQNAIPSNADHDPLKTSLLVLEPTPIEEFCMENLGGTGICGKTKCLYLLSSSPGFGYIVTQKIELKTLEETWEFGERLVKAHGIEHLSEKPREMSNITDSFASFLSSNLTLHKDLRGNKFHMQFVGNSSVVVQKVKVVPKPFLILTCRFKKFTRTMMDLEKFVISLRMTAAEANSFVCNLSQGINATKDLLMKERCLVSDFQAILDKEGNVNQFDLDRCYPPPPIPGGGICLKNLDAIVKQVKTILSNLTVR